jgi:signal transduction histidine kinase
MQRTLVNLLWRLGLAFGTIAAAVILTVLLRRFDIAQAAHLAPFFFLAAVLACSWVGGYTAGISSVLFALGFATLFSRREFDFRQIDPYRMAILLLVSATISWIAAHRRQVENNLRAGVEQKTAELRTAIENLEREVQERKAAEEEVRRLNHLLELRVNERTRQLEVSNQELESFSYSVSHDLRAPLRSIDGFSRILMGSCFGKFDDEERALFQRILAATGRMNELIDDLLNLARVTRTPINSEMVDLSGLATRIASDLHKDYPELETKFVIEPGLNAICDSSLAEVVLHNLLENACKFSSQSTSACVEFGATTSKDEHALFVRDNGAGFDPAYKSKLFAPFQRLHRQDEFPGTGIGLATVSRIVHRHGGWISAESEPGKGATFYFTLSSSPDKLPFSSGPHLPEEPKPAAPLSEAPSSPSTHSALT